MDNSKLSVLKTFSSAGEASIYQSLLESNGIRCELLNEGISDILPIPGDLSKIRLVVNADAAKAEEILAAGFDQEEFDTESAKRRKKP